MIELRSNDFSKNSNSIPNYFYYCFDDDGAPHQNKSLATIPNNPICLYPLNNTYNARQG